MLSLLLLRKANALFCRAQYMFFENDYKSAIQYTTHSWRLIRSPEQWEVLMLRADCHYFLDCLKPALADLETLIQLLRPEYNKYNEQLYDCLLLQLIFFLKQL